MFTESDDMFAAYFDVSHLKSTNKQEKVCDKRIYVYIGEK
jgi:hypothetical protein